MLAIKILSRLFVERAILLEECMQQGKSLCLLPTIQLQKVCDAKVTITELMCDRFSVVTLFEVMVGLDYLLAFILITIANHSDFMAVDQFASIPTGNTEQCRHEYGDD